MIAQDCWRIILAYAINDKDAWNAISLISKQHYRITQELDISYKLTNLLTLSCTGKKHRCIVADYMLITSQYGKLVMAYHCPTHVAVDTTNFVGKNASLAIHLGSHVRYFYIKYYGAIDIYSYGTLYCVMASKYVSQLTIRGAQKPHRILTSQYCKVVIKQNTLANDNIYC